MPRSYKDKLINFEVQPPPAAWDFVCDELLANNELIPVSNKLYDFQVSPPPNAWNKIKSSLKEEVILLNDFPVNIPKSRILYRVAAAAATIGIIILGLLYLNKPGLIKDDLAINPTTNLNNKKIPSPEPIANQSSPTIEPDTEKITDASPIIVSKTYKNFIANTKTLQKATVKNLLFHGNELQIMIAAKPIRNANGEIIENPEIMNNPVSKYISITSPNGQQTKISSKFLHMLLFINDESDIDEVDGYFDKNFLESLIWKSRFQDWRNEIIKTSFVPSSTNFMDILDFKDMIMKDR